MPKQDQGYNPKRSYLVTSEHQLRKLKLMNQVPHDDDPEVEEELLKMWFLILKDKFYKLGHMSEKKVDKYTFKLSD